MTFELEVAPAGTDDWDGSIDSGGENIVNEGTSNEGREYTMIPTLTMPSGDYDLRSRTVDNREQKSDWRITYNAFFAFRSVRATKKVHRKLNCSYRFRKAFAK